MGGSGASNACTLPRYLSNSRWRSANIADENDGRIKGPMSNRIDLSGYHKNGYTPGASFVVLLLWYFVGSPIVRSSWIPISRLKVLVLRVFGANIGRSVTIKPGVRVKYPWRLRVGDHVWIGEDAWIDNLADVIIESHVCLSQSTYLCTGIMTGLTLIFFCGSFRSPLAADVGSGRVRWLDQAYRLEKVPS